MSEITGVSGHCMRCHTNTVQVTASGMATCAGCRLYWEAEITRGLIATASGQPCPCRDTAALQRLRAAQEE